MAPAPRVHLVSTLKNEAPYIVEWLAWYQMLGVTDFTLFSNDCTDGTNLMLDRLDAMGEVRHFDNPLGPRMDPQRRAYSRAGRMDAVRAADWVLVVDADEFVHVTVGDGTLSALIEACGAPDAISLGWQPVGSGGAARWIDAPVTARFTKGGRLTPPENKMVPGFKTLFRPAVFDYFGVHRPKFDRKRRDTLPEVRWVNGSGVDIAERVTSGGWRFGGNSAGYDFGRVNHYAVKSREEFLLKRLRGTANSKNIDRLNLDYWAKFDLNSTHLPPLDTTGLKAGMDRLLADADLAALRRASVATARRVLQGQLNDPEARQFVQPLDARGAQGAEQAPGQYPVQSPALRADQRPAPRFSLVSVVRNAAPYLLDWIAWHRALGVERFCITSRDSTDGTDALLDRLAQMGMVEHRPLPPDRPPDPEAQRLAPDAPGSDAPQPSDWALYLEVDEYLDLADTNGGLAAFVAACDPEDRAHAISLARRHMGNHGHGMHRHLPVGERFLRGAALDTRTICIGFPVRTLVRLGAGLGVSPTLPRVPADLADPVWLDGAGADITVAMRAVGAASDSADALSAEATQTLHATGHVHGSIRHFAVRSRAEFASGRLTPTSSSQDIRAATTDFVVRNVNTCALPPLRHDRAQAALAPLLEDATLAALVETAREALDETVSRLLDVPAVRSFIESGTCAPQLSGAAIGTRVRAQQAGRILCVGTHHKTGTMWLRTTLRAIAEAQGIPMMQVGTHRHLARIPTDGPAICVNWQSDFPRALYRMKGVRFLHMIRDPRDVLLSGMRYHLIAPTARERFLLETRAEWGGRSYQQYLQELPDETRRLLFEMEHKHSDTVEEMLSWHYGGADSIELRYEDMIEDSSCARFRSALEQADIVGLDIGEAVKALWDNAIFGGLREQDSRHPRTALHIHSGRPEQWRVGLPREVAEAYAPRFGEALRVLGYAADDSWVAQCPPAEDLAPRHMVG